MKRTVSCPSAFVMPPSCTRTLPRAVSGPGVSPLVSMSMGSTRSARLPGTDSFIAFGNLAGTCVGGATEPGGAILTAMSAPSLSCIAMTTSASICRSPLTRRTLRALRGSRAPSTSDRTRCTVLSFVASGHFPRSACSSACRNIRARDSQHSLLKTPSTSFSMAMKCCCLLWSAIRAAPMWTSVLWVGNSRSLVNRRTTSQSRWSPPSVTSTGGRPPRRPGGTHSPGCASGCPSTIPATHPSVRPWMRSSNWSLSPGTLSRRSGSVTCRLSQGLDSASQLQPARRQPLLHASPPCERATWSPG
mmetsp:Transcript_18555/g.58245  ORF Transcript_18555/g.58245 Transcript_18555/m.58245 type:complete len:303 (-) Transcript_18555:612-1520(-)